MPSPEAPLSAEEQTLLLDIARRSIEHGLQTQRPLAIDTSEYSGKLAQPGASFVTLQRHGELRGCIGVLEAYQPLVNDVAENAFKAAFSDPRFAPLAASEFSDLAIHVSVLGQPEVISFTDENDLLRQIRPGIDGLILEDGYHRGTFLPSVWESLPTPEDFLRHLKQKAGLRSDHWSDTLRVSRYTTQSFPD
jgi:AmmeMemoRadiSam system protein A